MADAETSTVGGSGTFAPVVVRRLVTRRLGPVGLALTAYDVWRRLPPSARRRILAEGRKHAPAAAARGRALLEKGRAARAARRRSGD
jgi:hypothetical protein